MPPLFAMEILSAGAEVSVPHIVIGKNVWLLSDNDDRLFMLPETYYARINNLSETHYFINFNGVSGKVSKNSVSTTGYHLIISPTTVQARIDGNFHDFSQIALKERPAVTAQTVTEIPVIDSFTILGEYPQESGNNWYFVQYKSHFGYLQTDRTDTPSLTIETFNPAPPTNNPPNNSGNNPSANGGVFNGISGGALRIVIIIGLAIPAILIIFLIFRPSRNRKYYD